MGNCQVSPTLFGHCLAGIIPIHVDSIYELCVFKDFYLMKSDNFDKQTGSFYYLNTSSYLNHWQLQVGYQLGSQPPSAVNECS